MDIEDTVDHALQRIHAHADENSAGFTSHAPMVVDALIALDRADRIEPFLAGYLGGFPANGGTDPVSRAMSDAWAERIGHAGRWSDALDPALSELAPSLFAAATHGLIRVAHATRMLERADTPVRRHELARAFAYWEASAVTLPGEPACGSGTRLDPVSLIADLEVVPNEQRIWGLFTEGARVLTEHAPYTEVIARLAIPDVVDADAISGLTLAMLPAYFESPLLRIAYIHTITAPSALRLIAPHLSQATLRRLYPYAFQAIAALHAISKLPSEPAIDPEIARLAGDRTTLMTRAADTLEEHVIKFTEACLREHQATLDPRFLEAAADAIRGHENRVEASTW